MTIPQMSSADEKYGSWEDSFSLDLSKTVHPSGFSRRHFEKKSIILHVRTYTLHRFWHFFVVTKKASVNDDGKIVLRQEFIWLAIYIHTQRQVFVWGTFVVWLALYHSDK